MGVVTFLFTDIEGSTGRWEADADAMRNALAEHDHVLRKAIEAHDGWMFKHTGDGVLAAFASPRSAVDAAVAAQRALQLPVRMGIATGEAELRGEDYFGPVLNRAARAMGAGHGGQILVADSTAGLLSGIDLMALGPRRLRDVPTPIELFQVRADGLATEFPPLRSVDASQGNLRPAATSLVGRASDVARVVGSLRAHRLVTLTGVGGVGKTRLAIEVANHLADEFLDGVWLFELAAVNDPATVPDAVAAVLGITQQVGMNLTKSVATSLEGRVRLLMFDNCEHVLDAAADLIEAILAQSATVRILATSREPLGVADEQVGSVPSLSVDAGTDSAAVQLFAERARSLAQNFSMDTDAEAEAVVEICRRLDGIPLAIELAASRMASMTPTEVRDRLDQRFQLLVGSRRGLERHQTLRHAVTWSYDLLDDSEKALLERCSVFAGGFDLDGARAVTRSADDGDEFPILNILDALVRKSLIVADRLTGRTRFSMLETIRQFAEEQLVVHDGADEARTAHARFYAGREADVMTLWDSPSQLHAYEWFAVEVANLRSAFRWAADRGELDDAAPIATYAGLLGYCVENYEPLAWAEELVEPAETVHHPRLAYLLLIASMCWVVGRVDAAVVYSEEGQIAIGKGGEVPFGIEGMVTSVYTATGHLERNIEWCQAQLAHNRDTHTFLRSQLVTVLAITGSAGEAMATADGLIAAAEATGNPDALAIALLAYGLAFSDADPPAAVGAFRRGLAVARESGSRFSETHLAAGLIRIEAKYGDPLAVLEYVHIVIQNLHDSGNTATIRSPLALLAGFLDRIGRHEPAATITGFAVGPMATAGFPELAATVVHLREVLGDVAYESLARNGESMTTSAIVNYAYHQIDQARTELEHK
ncbi:ATP-binding protein [Mycobacterium sp. RTGN4]|nr:adenylate/guanylate cyclase domain-containing protein [Mycobacterium sp. RTGN4]